MGERTTDHEEERKHMDPNATLHNIRRYLGIAHEADLSEAEGNALAELMLSLDEWLSNGGFLPSAWSR